MVKKKIYLIRHGKASMDGIDRERNLDEDGKIQAISLCKKIKKQFKDKKVRIISSPFTRAFQTIESLSKDMNLNIEKSEILEEIKIGKDENLTKHQIIEKMWSNENFKVKKVFNIQNKLNISVDYSKDLNLVKKIIKLNKGDIHINSHRIIKFLKNNTVPINFPKKVPLKCASYDARYFFDAKKKYISLD